jgi:hypothetical protein
VLIIKVDGLYAEPFQAALRCRADVLRPAVDRSKGRVDGSHDAELGSQDHALAAAANRLPDQLLVGEGTVDVRRVGKIDAQIKCSMDSRDGLRLVSRPVELRHAHTPKSNGGYHRSILA